MVRIYTLTLKMVLLHPLEDVLHRFAFGFQFSSVNYQRNDEWDY